jgi:hypothetical protein
VDPAHRGIERGDEPASRLLYLDPRYSAEMLVRFAVRDEDETGALQVLEEIGHGPL